MQIEVSLNDPVGIGVIALGLFLGGILKGATGAGMPILAVPLIAAFYDVRVAVVVLVIPNLITNVWQVYKYRADNREPVFTYRFAFAGLVGAGVGTSLLVATPLKILNLVLAAILVAYIVLRILRPSLQIPMPLATRLAPVAGFVGGILQGTVGLSAPVAVTFANAIRFERVVFIFAISSFFAALCVTQIPFQIAYGLLTWDVAWVSVLALVPLLTGLPIGDYLGKRMNQVIFDRTILVMLALLALRQVSEALF